jgi:hypothetical protein
MAVLTFETSKLLTVVKHALEGTGHSMGYSGGAPRPALFIVKDSGAYLMSNAKRTEEEVKASVGLLYAKGYDPNKVDAGELYDKCHDNLGGDDFAETFPIDQKWVENCQKFKVFKMRINSRSITVTFSMK